MSMRILRKTMEPNLQLEALREKGLQESSLQNNEWILNMIRKTANIHAGFLFEDRKTLQDICLFVSATQNKITDAGWEAFGYHLGLSPSVLKVINYNNFNKEDPCYNTLLAYVQYENASIGKVIEALHSAGRIDVICRIQNSINDLADIILNCQNNSGFINNSMDDTSDYESLSTLEGSAPNSIIKFSTSEGLIRPRIIPPAPFIFQNIKGDPESTALQILPPSSNLDLSSSFSNSTKENCSKLQNFNEKLSCTLFINQNFETNISRETLQNSCSKSYEDNSKVLKKQKKYGLKILLTFAEDGEKYVDEICKIFRKKRENYPQIGVLVLSEHSANVNKDPHQFISGSFYQVDYVCPILTTGYFNLISKKTKAVSLSNMHIDASFVPYIYRLMNSYFVSNDCLNDKIRCIIPQNEFSSPELTLFLSNPVFGAWVKLSEVDELALRLLKSNVKTI